MNRSRNATSFLRSCQTPSPCVLFILSVAQRLVLLKKNSHPSPCPLPVRGEGLQANSTFNNQHPGPFIVAPAAKESDWRPKGWTPTSISHTGSASWIYFRCSVSTL